LAGFKSLNFCSGIGGDDHWAMQSGLYFCRYIPERCPLDGSIVDEDVKTGFRLQNFCTKCPHRSGNEDITFLFYELSSVDI
jgi:hypothetical protein